MENKLDFFRSDTVCHFDWLSLILNFKDHLFTTSQSTAVFQHTNYYSSPYLYKAFIDFNWASLWYLYTLTNMMRSFPPYIFFTAIFQIYQSGRLASLGCVAFIHLWLEKSQYEAQFYYYHPLLSFKLRSYFLCVPVGHRMGNISFVCRGKDQPRVWACNQNFAFSSHHSQKFQYQPPKNKLKHPCTPNIPTQQCSLESCAMMLYRTSKARTTRKRTSASCHQ